MTSPTAAAPAAVSAGVSISGAVTDSTSGMESLSVLYTMSCPLSLTSRQASSSRLSWKNDRFLPRKGIEPFTPIIAVRWKPVGMLPSRYCFRVMCISSTSDMLNIMAISMAISTALLSALNGGVSSIS